MPDRFDWERAVRDSNLPAPSKLLLLVLGTRVGRRCRRPYPSVRQLAEDTSLGRSTVLKHIAQLTEAGRFLQKVERTDEAGRSTSNEYRLVLTTEVGVQEIDPGVQKMDPRGSRRWTGEGPAGGPEGSKREESKEKVWAHYLSRYANRYGKDRADRLKLAACGRDRHLNARFGEGYTVEELCQAIDGCFDDPWHAEKKKDELQYIIRDQGQVEEFLKRADRNGGPPTRTPDDVDAELEALE